MIAIGLLLPSLEKSLKKESSKWGSKNRGATVFSIGNARDKNDYLVKTNQRSTKMPHFSQKNCQKLRSFLQNCSYFVSQLNSKNQMFIV